MTRPFPGDEARGRGSAITSGPCHLRPGALWDMRQVGPVGPRLVQRGWRKRIPDV